MSVIEATQPRRLTGFGRNFQIPLLTALAYYLGAEAAFAVGTLSDKIFAPFWPPNIVLFCALLLTPYSRWWLYILAVLPAHIFAEHRVGMPPLPIAVAFVTNCAVAMLNAAAVRRFIGGPPWFGTLRAACLYVLITTVVSPMICAVGGAFVPVLIAGTTERYLWFWAQWFLSNAVGSLAVGPIALMLLTARRSWLRSLTVAMTFEPIVLGGLLIAVCTVAFETNSFAIPSSFIPTLIYLPLPLVLWAALRFGAFGAASAILAVTIVLIWRALNAPSLFQASDPETSVFAMQAFLLGLSIPILLLGASIEETRRAEDAVRSSEERMAFAAISADCCMWHIDFQSDRFWVTDYGRDMLGLDTGGAISRTAVVQAIHLEDRQHAFEAMRVAAADGRLIDCEFRIVKPNGDIRWLRCRARAHGNYRGASAEISGTFADITERKNTENELARQQQEIAHLTRVSMLSELSGGLAHELTQPLSAILSNAEAVRIILKQDRPDLKEAVAALDDIISEDNRAGEVIHRLRSLLKKSEARFEAVDVNDVVGSTLRLLHNELITRRVKVRTNLKGDLPPILGDQIQLQQVMLNLLLNAMDAMNDVVPPRRMITISTNVGDEEDIRVDIADSGSGLASSYQERVFQPFFTTKERGLGLGLSLSSAIMRLHGGTLRLVNNPNGGATASFSLPQTNSREPPK